MITGGLHQIMHRLPVIRSLLSVGLVDNRSKRKAETGKDFASAVVIGAFAMVFMVLSLRLEVPGSTYTAPGMLPFIVSLTLFFMAVGLGIGALRQGSLGGSLGELARHLKNYAVDQEGRRTVMLIGMVFLYVFLVAVLSFDFRVPVFFFDFEITSYEVVSILAIGMILRIFWKKSLVRCGFVSLIMIEVLVSVFRYGFGMIMPEAF